MKLKQKAQDFRVRELLDERYLSDRGRFRVYRVTKKKLTSMEAAAKLAELSGVPAGEVAMAGLKDRQGVTIQFMSVQGGRPVFWKSPDLRIETAGYAATALSSTASLGNEFEITLRGLTHDERDELVRGVAEVKAYGLPNYFGEQRFGNLRHGQGWIARDLARGKHEDALKKLLCGRSEHDDDHNSRFKGSLEARWGDWRICREIAGKFGNYISVFQHLAREEGDFAGAFRFVKSQVRLIHLFAWQSHLWNRALAAYIDEITPSKNRFAVSSPEGVLVFARGAMAIDPAMKGKFRLPGPGLDDVTHPHQRDLLALELRKQGLQPHEFRIEGVSGFQLKGEDRAILVHPRKLMLEEDRSGRTVVRFELPRGAYATLVMARLVPPRPGQREESSAPREQRGAPFRGNRPKSAGRDARVRDDRPRRTIDNARPRADQRGATRPSDTRPFTSAPRGAKKDRRTKP